MKPGSRIPIMVTVVVLAVLASTIFLRGRGGPGPGEATEGTAGAPQPEASAAPGTSSSRPRAAVANSGIPAAAGAPAMLQEQMERRARMREEQGVRTRALRDQSAKRYDNEAVDPAWASAKESELLAFADQPEFDEVDARPASLSIDCRSSICKLDAQFENRTQAEKWIMMYTSSAGGAMPSAITSRNQNPDGSTHVEIYGRAR